MLSNTALKAELGNLVEEHVSMELAKLDLHGGNGGLEENEKMEVRSELNCSTLGTLPELPSVGREKIFELGDAGAFEMES